MDGVVASLRAFYGPLAPPPHEIFAFFVWDVVSARALPARRDVAWQALKRVPALTPDAMFRASKADLESALSAVGAVEQRIEALKNGSGHFRRHRELGARVRGPLAGAVRALIDVPHLTAGARIRGLLFAGGHALAPVDDEVARVLARLQGFESGSKARVRREGRRRLFQACHGERDRIAEAVVVLAHHAAHACLEHAPHCAVCPLAADCRRMPVAASARRSTPAARGQTPFWPQSE